MIGDVPMGTKYRHHEANTFAFVGKHVIDGRVSLAASVCLALVNEKRGLGWRCFGRHNGGVWLIIQVFSSDTLLHL